MHAKYQCELWIPKFAAKVHPIDLEQALSKIYLKKHQPM